MFTIKVENMFTIKEFNAILIILYAMKRDLALWADIPAKWICVQGTFEKGSKIWPVYFFWFNYQKTPQKT